MTDFEPLKSLKTKSLSLICQAVKTNKTKQNQNPTNKTPKHHHQNPLDHLREKLINNSWGKPWELEHMRSSFGFRYRNMCNSPFSYFDIPLVDVLHWSCCRCELEKESTASKQQE